MFYGLLGFRELQLGCFVKYGRVALVKVATVGTIPARTNSIDQAKSDIAEHGVAILSDVLSPLEFAALRDAVYAEAEVDQRTGRADDPYFADIMLGNATQRVWNLPSRSQIFCDLAVHPVALEMVKSVVDGGVRLSTFSANITLPGSGMMHLHADQGLDPMPWGEKPHGLNLIWCIDDFTEETGATRFVPGSHKLNRSAASMEEIMSDTVPLEAPAGTLLMMESRVWHKTGANVTKDRKRAAILAHYSMDCFVPNENWWLTLAPHVRQSKQSELLRLLGFGSDSPLGRVNGRPAV
jgi:ectoine hydroxylase-related dioxygenase (phytanoyl-CoA dioxygenase family)